MHFSAILANETSMKGTLVRIVYANVAKLIFSRILHGRAVRCREALGAMQELRNSVQFCPACAAKMHLC